MITAVDFLSSEGGEGWIFFIDIARLTIQTYLGLSVNEQDVCPVLALTSTTPSEVSFYLFFLVLLSRHSLCLPAHKILVSGEILGCGYWAGLMGFKSWYHHLLAVCATSLGLSFFISKMSVMIMEPTWPRIMSSEWVNTAIHIVRPQWMLAAVIMI